jgi:hypothetical protein
MKRLVIGFILSMLTGCFATSQRSDYISKPDMVTFQIRNSNWHDITVYIVENDTRRRLGFVTAATTKTFRLRENALHPSGSIQLQVVLFAARDTFTSDIVNISGAPTVVWDVRQPLYMSAIHIYE